MTFQTKIENVRIVNALAQVLAETPMGGTTPYNRLNAVAGINVEAGRRDLLTRAQRKAEQQCSCIFAAVRGVGIKRLVADETPQVGSQAIAATRKKTKRAIDRMVRVNSNSMSSDARNNTSLKLAHLQIIHGISDNRRTATFAAPAAADPYAIKKAIATGDA